MGARVAKLVPARAVLRVIAVRGDLHGRPRPVFVEPSDRPHALLLQTVAPQREVIGLGRMHTKLGLLARANPLWPSVTKQPISQQPKLIRMLGWNVQLDHLRTMATAGEKNSIVSGWDVELHRAIGTRTCVELLPVTFKRHENVAERQVTFVAHIADQHGVNLLECSIENAVKPHP